MSTAADLVERARDLYGKGATAAALEACERAADLAREDGDAATLADAATVIRTGHGSRIAARVHELCVEALARLGERDPVRTARVRAQLVATSNPFGPPEPLDLPPESDDPEAAFLRLQAWHSARFAIDHLPERLAIADQAIELGRRTGTSEYAAWGRRWRMDAYAVLGERVDLMAELQALRPLVERLDSPSWRAYLLLVESSQRALEGRYDDALRLADAAAAADAHPHGDSAFLRVVMRSAIAVQTGRGLAENEREVRALVDGMPYLANGWICILLKSRDARAEAEDLWRSLAPHVDRMPTRAPEWVIACAGEAEVAAWLGDEDSARVLYRLLTPYSGLQAVGLSHAPYEGPVDLALGRLAATVGDPGLARTHLRAALRQTEVLHALPYQALVLAELAALGDRTSADRARALADRLGLAPVLARLSALSGLSARGPLTPREADIAALVADGLSNSAIAERFTLSERTVENHVSNILRKLDLTSRAGIASWWARRPGRTH